MRVCSARVLDGSRTVKFIIKVLFLHPIILLIKVATRIVNIGWEFRLPYDQDFVRK